MNDILLGLILATATAADIETTRVAMRGGATELNPVMARVIHSRARSYAAAGALNTFALSTLTQKRWGRWRVVPTLVAIGVHSVAAISNARKKRIQGD
jgi:hypothetical protein